MPEFLQGILDPAGGPVVIPLLRIAGVIIGGIALLKLLDSALRRLRLLIPADRRGTTRGEQRAETLRHIMQSVGRVVILILVILQVIAVLGYDIGPALASVGILGVAIGFGAQSLVKDVISGFFVLLEDQYGVGDVVRIGEFSGVVEEMTLRTTILRNLQGQVHVIPNGTIQAVTVMTKDWARAVVDVPVAYGADLDPGFDILSRVAEKLHADWPERVLEVPQLMGVEDLGVDRLTVRMMVRTPPGKQWEVMREWRKRVKEEFDRQKIEIPLPQRSITIRDQKAEPSSPVPPAIPANREHHRGLDPR